MLVLSRHVSEKIHIGSEITITVVRIAGDKVRIGIDAPPELNILRDELVPNSKDEDNGHLGNENEEAA